MKKRGVRPICEQLDRPALTSESFQNLHRGVAEKRSQVRYWVLEPHET